MRWGRPLKNWLKSLFNGDGMVATGHHPYRRVITRGPIKYHANGDRTEVVDLECGHTIELLHHTRNVIPCPDCAIEHDPPQIP